MKLYYGNGSCTIEGSNAKAVHIRYRGAIEIEDKTSGSFAIAHKNKQIIIFPIGEGVLNDLFDYVGEIKITSVMVADSNAEKAHTSIHRVMDYTELLNTKSEDMTTNSEDLSSTYVSGGKVAKTVLRQPHIPNLHTSTNKVSLFFEDGTEYNGSFHIHLDDGGAMTGDKHTKESQDLYLSTGNPTRNKGLPYKLIHYRTGRKIESRRIHSRRIQERKRRA